MRVTSSPFVSPLESNSASPTPVNRSRVQSLQEGIGCETIRGSHRWSVGTQKHAEGATSLVREDAVGNVEVTLCLGRVSREVFGDESNSQRASFQLNPNQNATVLNTPVNLVECVLFSLAVPAAPGSQSQATILEQLKYLLAVSALIKNHPVEFQRL